ncbi:MAG: ATP-binding cassette domain-containing protein [Ruminococcaceae bacterium]|nr:ATP-binding cassette domain-containing protein [Oscillospiraceae bacterium]
MELVRFCDYTFKYPDAENNALNNINLVVNQGEFVTVCGKSGSGKSTLLKSMKPDITPHGEASGKILFCGEESSGEVNYNKIGFVMQNPHSQIVTDKVWHELAFGLENMGMNSDEMRVRVAEIASFFGIESWFHMDTGELSGGQKQILNLASVMVMEPEMLVLDEPTSQLDPISADNFLEILNKINKELGTAVVISEHRCSEVFAYSDRIIVVEDGEIIVDDEQKNVAKRLKNHDMFEALPSYMQIYEVVDGGDNCPKNIPEARRWLEKYTQNCDACAVYLGREDKRTFNETALSVKDLRYKYDKSSKYVLSGLSMEVKKGEIFGILGGNGSGKSTLLWLISKGIKMQGGKRKVNGRVGMLPQNPESLFLKNTVLADLEDLADAGAVEEIMREFRIEHLKDRHPHDLSGGEQQRLAMCKVLLTKPDILLLDEPTKGFDAHFKKEFGNILKKLTSNGITVVMVSHDVEFCGEICDRCGLIFDGKIVSTGAPKEFFGGKKFYTTQTARIFKGFADSIISTSSAVQVLKFLEGEK